MLYMLNVLKKYYNNKNLKIFKKRNIYFISFFILFYFKIGLLNYIVYQ